MIFSRWLGKGRSYRHLRPGKFYRLTRAFEDHDGRVHEAGQRWRMVDHSFLPYEDGLTLRFITDDGEDRIIRLQMRPESEGEVVDGLEALLVACEAPSRAARAGLRGVSEAGIVAFDGIDTITVSWADIGTVTAAYGRQQYDETICIEIDHRRGTTIFLPETESLFEPFLTLLARQPECVPRSHWEQRLTEHKEQATRVFPAKH